MPQPTALHCHGYVVVDTAGGGGIHKPMTAQGDSILALEIVLKNACGYEEILWADLDKILLLEKNMQNCWTIIL